MADRDHKSREISLATYFRVTFYGAAFNELNNNVYIYKEPGNTKLFEMCDRLKKVYTRHRLGTDSGTLEILNDNRKVKPL